MNQQIFENIALELECVLEDESNRLQKLVVGDTKEARLNRFLFKYYPHGIEDVNEANNVAILLINTFKHATKRNYEFNTNMLAFTSLYYFMKLEGILDKIDEKMIMEISEIFDKEEEKEFFFGLILALNEATEDSFLQLLNLNNEIEIVYVCLATIYIQQILDYRTERKDKKYDNLAYCFSKMDGILRKNVLYGYSYIDFVSFKVFESKPLEHYKICLPYVHVRELSDLEGEYEVRENKDIDWEKFQSNASYNKNTLYCHQAIVQTGKLYDEMGIIISKMGNFVDKLEQQNADLKKKNTELKKMREQRIKLVNHLAHSWGNECYPEIVKKVADELLKVGNNSLANRLFKAYNSENNLMGQIIFLQAAMDDNPETLKNIFTNSFYISGDGTDEMKIGRLIEDTLEIMIFGLLNDKQEKEKRKKCCEKISIKHSISELAADYAKRFEEMNQEESFVNWFCNNIFPLNISIDDTWQSVNMGQTEYGKIVLKNIFTELITNVLIHGKEWCEISLKSSVDRMYIEVRNTIESDVSYTRKGLSSLREIISRLNYDTCVSESEGIVYAEISENEYVTTITFAKELMVVEEEW